MSDEAINVNQNLSTDQPEKKDGVLFKGMMSITKFFWFLIILAIVWIVIGLIVRNTPGNKAIATAKEMQFSEGSSLEVEADLHLEDVNWTSENLGNDRWAVYLTGYSPKYDSDLNLEVVLTDYGDSIKGEVTYVEIDGVGYDDPESIKYAVAIVYDTVETEFVNDLSNYLLGF